MEAETFVLLDNSLEKQGKKSYLFWKPIEIITCDRPQEIEDTLDKLMNAKKRNLYAAGWLSFELGYYLEHSLQKFIPEKQDTPLMWFGLFSQMLPLTNDEVYQWLLKQMDTLGEDFFIYNLKKNIKKTEYLEAFHKIQEYIKNGDTYQINYTFKYHFDIFGSYFALYQSLRNAQPCEYGALINTPDQTILSLSPELFIRKEEENITCKPMKGTMGRGKTEKEDEDNAIFLNTDPKSQAENVMIVDLLRNDMSRIAKPGSVEVTKLFEVEKYPTLFQMTSTIQAEVDPDLEPGKLIKQLFPCGSVTGTPKIRTIEIINELELERRGIYTGSIGYFTPNQLCLNVAIRSLVLNKEGKGEMGIGSGIIADSNADLEYDECLLKALFLTKNQSKFNLFESMLLLPDGIIWLYNYHLSRLEKAAEFFNYSWDLEKIEFRIKKETAQVDQSQSWRLRLEIFSEGDISIQLFPMGKDYQFYTDFKKAVFLRQPIPLIKLSEKKVDTLNPFLYYKTTKRKLFESELAKLRKEFDYFDVIFTNEKGEITEGSRTNIFIQIGQEILTPPIKCGLLGGTFRKYLMENSKVNIREQILKIEDLYSAEKIFVGNSIRGLHQVKLTTKPL